MFLCSLSSGLHSRVAITIAPWNADSVTEVVVRSAENLNICKDLWAHIVSWQKLCHSQDLHVFNFWKQQDNTCVKIPARLITKVIWQEHMASNVRRLLDESSCRSLLQEESYFLNVEPLVDAWSQASKHSVAWFFHFEVITWCLMHYFCW